MTFRRRKALLRSALTGKGRFGGGMQYNSTNVRRNTANFPRNSSNRSPDFYQLFEEFYQTPSILPILSVFLPTIYRILPVSRTTVLLMMAFTAAGRK
jgi:hypothetical protein